MNIYEFASNNPILTIFLFLIIAQLIQSIVVRLIRTVTIHKHGYPPEHCDADGDFKD
jgi:hypothetical protein